MPKSIVVELVVHHLANQPGFDRDPVESQRRRPYARCAAKPSHRSRVDPETVLPRVAGERNQKRPENLEKLVPLHASERARDADVPLKVKPERTAECIVGGFRLAGEGEAASLLLGAFADDGDLRFRSAPKSNPAWPRMTISPSTVKLVSGSLSNASASSGKYRPKGLRFRLWRSTQPPARKATARKPSHFGS
jgi:hypothetical protein